MKLNMKDNFWNQKVNNSRVNWKLEQIDDDYSRCRWSPTIGSSILFLKHNFGHINMLDVERKALILKESVKANDGIKNFWYSPELKNVVYELEEFIG